MQGLGFPPAVLAMHRAAEQPGQPFALTLPQRQAAHLPVCWGHVGTSRRACLHVLSLQGRRGSVRSQDWWFSFRLLPSWTRDSPPLPIPQRAREPWKVGLGGRELFHFPPLFAPFAASAEFPTPNGVFIGAMFPCIPMPVHWSETATFRWLGKV